MARGAKGGPAASRPEMPGDYQIAGPRSGKGLLDWAVLRRRMQRAHNYWIGTTRPDGRPHAMPVWGVWIDDALVFGTDRRSRKARNLAANSACVAHAESGDQVAIVEGVAEEVTDGKEIAAADAAYRRKYRMRLVEAPGELVIYRVRPRAAFAWQEKDFNQSATRWRARG